jgi:hypothetical protein
MAIEELKPLIHRLWGSQKETDMVEALGRFIELLGSCLVQGKIIRP